MHTRVGPLGPTLVKALAFSAENASAVCAFQEASLRGLKEMHTLTVVLCRELPVVTGDLEAPKGPLNHHDACAICP